MNLTPLSKKRTEELETTTIPIETLTGYQKPYLDHLFRIQSWYHVHGLTTNHPQTDFFATLSALLQHKPQYYKRYEYKNAVWGFEWEREEFILYKSKKGTSIQIPKTFRTDKLEPFLQALSDLLKVNDIESPFP